MLRTPRRGFTAVVLVLAFLGTGCMHLVVPSGDAPLRYRDLVFNEVTTTTGIQYGQAPNQQGQTVNLLLDTPAGLRNAELADLKQRLGDGAVDAIEPTHALAGSFTLACQRGCLKATIVLSPERQPGIQKLGFSIL